MKAQAIKEQNLTQDLEESQATINELVSLKQDLEVDRQRLID